MGSRIAARGGWWAIACALLIYSSEFAFVVETQSAPGQQQSQSLLSMYGHEELVPLVRSFGIDAHFRRVDGRDGTSGTTGKGQYLVRHLAALGRAVAARDDLRGRTVLIGDVPDDAAAAAEAGVRAVLYTGGAGSRRELSRVGVPVADTLAEAVSLAEQLVA